MHASVNFLKTHQLMDYSEIFSMKRIYKKVEGGRKEDLSKDECHRLASEASIPDVPGNAFVFFHDTIE